MTGFYLVPRGHFDHPIFEDEPFCRRAAWLWLVEHAAYNTSSYRDGSKDIVLKRGQLCMSLGFMAHAWGWKKARAQRFIDRLKADTMIDTTGDTHWQVITICNYSQFSPADTITDPPPDTPSDTNSKKNKKKAVERESYREERARGDQSGQTKFPPKHDLGFNGKVIAYSQDDLTLMVQLFKAIDLMTTLRSEDRYLASLPRDAPKRAIGAWRGYVLNKLTKLNAAALNPDEDDDGPITGSESYIIPGRTRIPPDQCKPFDGKIVQFSPEHMSGYLYRYANVPDIYAWLQAEDDYLASLDEAHDHRYQARNYIRDKLLDSNSNDPMTRAWAVGHWRCKLNEMHGKDWRQAHQRGAISTAINNTLR